jgi:hypothetical protein
MHAGAGAAMYSRAFYSFLTREIFASTTIAAAAGAAAAAPPENHFLLYNYLEF